MLAVISMFWATDSKGHLIMVLVGQSGHYDGVGMLQIDKAAH
jgi:hypothetical protein